MVLQIGSKTFIVCLLAIIIGTAALTLSAQVIYGGLDRESNREPVTTSTGECSVGTLSLLTPGMVREFESLSQLKGWLTLDDLDSFQYMGSSWDCDDFAFELQRRAMRDGYYMSVQVEETQYGETHITNITKIGNTLYAVAPETDEVYELCPID